MLQKGKWIHGGITIVLRVKVLFITLITVSFLSLPGCSWDESIVRTNTKYETSLGLAVSVSAADQPEMTDTDVQTKSALLDTSALDPTPDLTTAVGLTGTTEIPKAAPVTAADISALPAGSVVDEFLKSEDIVNGCFYSSEISTDIFARMDGKSYKEECTVPLSDLRYLRVLYYGFDSCVHTGELVVNKKIAPDITEIFRALYDARYPIGKMVLVDEYNADDNASMADNNTSSFNYRTVNGSSTLSKHAQGLAIDINPLYNPWIYTLDGKTVIDPPAGEQFADRTLDNVYYLDHYDLCYKLFIAHGFTWGGDWKSSKDYQHFQKTS